MYIVPPSFRSPPWRLSWRRRSAIVFLRRRDAGTQSDRPAEVGHAHFRDGDAGQRHDIGQAAEMADAEDLARHLAEADAESDVVLVGGQCHTRSVPLKPSGTITLTVSE